MIDLPKNARNKKIWDPLGHFIYLANPNNLPKCYKGRGQGARPLDHLDPNSDSYKPDLKLEDFEIIIAGASGEYTDGFEAGMQYTFKRFLGETGLNKIGCKGSDKYRVEKKVVDLIEEYNQSLRIPRVEMNALIDGNPGTFPNDMKGSHGDGYYELYEYQSGQAITIRQYMKDSKELFHVKYDTKALKTDENINKVNEVFSELFPELEVVVNKNKNIEIEIQTGEEIMFELYEKFSEFVEKTSLHK